MEQLRELNEKTPSKGSGKGTADEIDLVQMLTELCFNLSFPTLTSSIVLMRLDLDELFLLTEIVFRKNNQRKEEERQRNIQEEGVWF